MYWCKKLLSLFCLRESEECLRNLTPCIWPLTSDPDESGQKLTNRVNIDPGVTEETNPAVTQFHTSSVRLIIPPSTRLFKFPVRLSGFVGRVNGYNQTVCVCVCVCVCDKLKQRTFLLCVFNLCQVCPDMSRCVSTPQSFSSIWMTNSLLISAATCLTHYWRSLNVSTQWTTRICQLLRQVGMQLTSVFIIGSFYHHF